MLSESAQELLNALTQGKPYIYIPKRTVEHQWPSETRRDFQELIQAGMVEEMVVYRLVVKEETKPTT